MNTCTGVTTTLSSFTKFNLKFLVSLFPDGPSTTCGTINLKSNSVVHLFILFCCFHSLARIAPLSLVIAQFTPIPFSPPAVPLAVRSPYHNAWLCPGTGTTARLWQNSVLTWYAAVRVDNITYEVLGNNGMGQPVTRSMEYTATRTSFLAVLGPMTLNMTFLSPVEPTDLVQLSLPFSYFCMNLTSNDGGVHDVQVYSDVTAEWVSGDYGAVINWTQSVDDTAVILKAQVATPQPFIEVANHAQDVTLYYSMATIPNQSWQMDQDFVARSLFSSSGVLANTSNDTFRGVDVDWPIFAISVDLGSIIATSEPIVWALGSVRDPAIQYVGSSGETQLRRSYYWSQYSSDIDLVKGVLSDFSRAYNAAIDFDRQLAYNASSISQSYAELVTLATRHVFGSMEITLGIDELGKWNMSDVKIFMKNIDAADIGGSVNSADAIFSALPTFMTLSPNFIKFLLEPLFEHQEDPLFIADIALSSLGSYPNATGTTLEPNAWGITENANMLILTLAYSEATGDNSLITAHYPLLKRWTDYLVNTTLIPGDQTTADDFNSVNQTNVAVKGILGIKAMSILSEFAQQSEDEAMYRKISDSYFSQWETLAMTSNNSHAIADYGSNTSWALMYSFYADKLLQMNLIPLSLYQTQNAFYKELQSEQPYGVLTDSSFGTARIDYQMLTAATTTDDEARDNFVALIHNYAGVPGNAFNPLTLVYTAATGESEPLSNGAGTNNPAIGAIFSLLALQVPLKQVSSGTADNMTTHSTPSSSTDTDTIVGGVVGGLTVVGIVVAAIWCCHRRRQHRYEEHPELRPNIRSLKALLSQPNAQLIQLRGFRSDRAVNSLISQRSISEQGVYSFSRAQSALASSETQQLAHTGRSATYAATVGSSDTDRHIDYANSQSGYRITSHSTPQSLNPESDAAHAGTLNDRPEGTDSTHRADWPARSQVMAAKQTLLNEQLRLEMESLKRDIERMGQERPLIVVATPPSYS